MTWQLSVDKKKCHHRFILFLKIKMELKSMNSAVILCGGKGTRLGNLGKKIPKKALVSIHTKPIIWYIINILISKGFNHFILPTGYKGIMIKKYIKN